MPPPLFQSLPYKLLSTLSFDSSLFYTKILLPLQLKKRNGLPISLNHTLQVTPVQPTF